MKKHHNYDFILKNIDLIFFHSNFFRLIWIFIALNFGIEKIIHIYLVSSLRLDLQFLLLLFFLKAQMLCLSYLILKISSSNLYEITSHLNVCACSKYYVHAKVALNIGIILIIYVLLMQYIYIYIKCYIINLNLIDNEQIEIKMNLVYVSFHIYILFFNISR